MASRVLLLSPNRLAMPDPVFPLGLAHLSAALRRAGHQVQWLDFQADDPQLDEVLARDRPDLIGISLRNIDDVHIRKQQVFFNEVISLCQTIRGVTASPVVLGGSGFSIYPNRLMELTGADFGVHGEGEFPLVSLVAALENGRSYEGIPGLVYRKGGRLTRNPPQPSPFQEALSDADYPDRLVDYYLKNTGMLNLQTQRGCAWTCCYCTYPLIEGQRHRRRPPDLVAEELERLQKRGARYVCIVDSVFNSTSAHVVEFCEAVLKRNVRLKWGCFLRPQGLSSEVVQLMARAGLAHIEFGSDSFCDAVLAAYGKHFSFADILHASQLAHRAGVDYCHYLICGGPGETPQTLETSFAQAEQLPGAVFLAVVGMRIYPGTSLCQRALQEGVIGRESDLLRPTYYLSPGWTAEEIFRQLQAFVRRSPQWIVGDPSPGYARAVERLRKRGMVGPLWSYFAMMQRILPQTAPQANP